MRSKNIIKNVPSVDCSYKYAGGGILSTTSDLAKFGNHILQCYMNNKKEQSNFLKSSTIKSYLWSPQTSIEDTDKDKTLSPELEEETMYGLGWFLCLNSKKQLKYVYHTGGAVGATSCLMIVPSNGVVISVLSNLEDCKGISKFTRKISKIFSD
jgi:serine beta-lactamase-like protein LACTB, mitochondrial